MENGQTASVLFPPHKCGLYLDHNRNRDLYLTVEEWAEQENNQFYQWQDDESRTRAVESNELWTLHWYPDTPIGFYAIAAPTLEELLAWATCH